MPATRTRKVPVAKAAPADTATATPAATPAMASASPSTPVNMQQVRKAVNALLSHAEKRTPATLLDDAAGLWLIVAVKHIGEQGTAKPIRIPLAHSILAPDAPLLLITKDPQRKFKDLLAEKKVTGVTKVIGISKLRNRYKPYEAKRQLCNEYDLFLADERVVTLLPPLLGKTFFDKKKQPAPIDLTKGNTLQREIDAARNSTYLHLSRGACHAVRIGLTSQSSDEIFENIKTALPAIVNKIPKKWNNIQSINIKTNSSIALPVYTSLPEESTPEVPAVVIEEEAAVETVEVEKPKAVKAVKTIKAVKAVKAVKVGDADKADKAAKVVKTDKVAKVVKVAKAIKVVKVDKEGMTLGETVAAKKVSVVKAVTDKKPVLSKKRKAVQEVSEKPAKVVRQVRLQKLA